jgi:hypothetical protein
MPVDAARDAVIAVQARVIGALAADNARLAGQVVSIWRAGWNGWSGWRRGTAATRRCR